MISSTQTPARTAIASGSERPGASGRLYQPLQMRSARNLGRYSRDELRLIHDFLVSSVELTADYVPTQNVESDGPGRR
jgi:hypothetical protein